MFHGYHFDTCFNYQVNLLNLGRNGTYRELLNTYERPDIVEKDNLMKNDRGYISFSFLYSLLKSLYGPLHWEIRAGLLQD